MTVRQPQEGAGHRLGGQHRRAARRAPARGRATRCSECRPAARLARGLHHRRHHATRSISSPRSTGGRTWCSCWPPRSDGCRASRPRHWRSRPTWPASTTSSSSASAPRPDACSSRAPRSTDRTAIRWTRSDSIPQPNNRYALTKWLGEQLVEYEVRAAGLRAVTLRPCMLYDEHETVGEHRSAMIRFVSNLARGRPIEVHRGSARSWLHVADAVRAIEAAGRLDEYAVINLGHPDIVPMADLAEMIRAELNASPELVVTTELPPKMTLIKRPTLDRQRTLLDFEPGHQPRRRHPARVRACTPAPRADVRDPRARGGARRSGVRPRQAGSSDRYDRPAPGASARTDAVSALRAGTMASRSRSASDFALADLARQLSRAGLPRLRPGLSEPGAGARTHGRGSTRAATSRRPSSSRSNGARGPRCRPTCRRLLRRPPRDARLLELGYGGALHLEEIRRSAPPGWSLEAVTPHAALLDAGAPPGIHGPRGHRRRTSRAKRAATMPCSRCTRLEHCDAPLRELRAAVRLLRAAAAGSCSCARTRSPRWAAASRAGTGRGTTFPATACSSSPRSLPSLAERAGFVVERLRPVRCPADVDPLRRQLPADWSAPAMAERSGPPRRAGGRVAGGAAEAASRPRAARRLDRGGATRAEGRA